MQEEARLRPLVAAAELASTARDVETLLAGAVRIALSCFAAAARIELADAALWSSAPVSPPSEQAEGLWQPGLSAGALREGVAVAGEQSDPSERVIPLTVEGRALGVFAFTGAIPRSGEKFDPDEATPFAAIIALALENLTLRRRLSDESRVRRQILSTVSHDFRTPLTTIRGVAQLLLRRRGQAVSAGNTQLDDRLSLIDRAVVQLGGMIDEVIDFARLETGGVLELNLEPVDLDGLAQRVAEEQQATTDEHDVRVESPAEPIVGSWDARRIERVVSKLVSNAIRYSPSGGRVRIRVSYDVAGASGPGWADLVVIDDGVGIASTELPGLLGDGPRSGADLPAKRGGRLDLVSCRRIIEQHGGRMLVQSEEGKGSTFTISLPLVADRH
jgi:signal transduction histidine kinase